MNLKGIERIKMDYNPETGKHEIFGRIPYFYRDGEKTYEGWEPMGAIEDNKNWEKTLIKLVKYFLKEDAS